MLVFQYSIFSFLMYGYYCINSQYLPLHFHSINLSSFQITLINLSSQIGCLIIPMIILYLEKFFSLKLVSKFSAIFYSVTIILTFYFHNFSILLILALIRLALFRVNYLIETQSMLDLEQKYFNFEKVRAIGSIGYILYAVFFGLIYDHYGLQGVILPAILLALFYTISAYKLSNKLNLVEKSDYKFNYKEILPILLVAVMFWISFAPQFLYSSLYLTAIKFTGIELGISLLVAVGIEVLFMFNFKKFKHILSINNWFILSALMTIIRFSFYFFTTNKYIIMFLHSFHIFSFIIPYLIIIDWIKKNVCVTKFHASQSYFNTATNLGYIIGQVICLLYATQIKNNLELLNAYFITFFFNLAAIFCVIFFLKDKKIS